MTAVARSFSLLRKTEIYKIFILGMKGEKRRFISCISVSFLGLDQCLFLFASKRMLMYK